MSAWFAPIQSTRRLTIESKPYVLLTYTLTTPSAPPLARTGALSPNLTAKTP